MAGDSAAAAMDMSQFMDVVTTFKCKACTFTCHKQEELLHHVKAEHIAPKEPAPVSPAPTLETGTDPQHSEEIPPLQPVIPAAAAATLMQTDTPGLSQIQIQTYVDGQPTEQVVLVDTTGTGSTEDERQFLADSGNSANTQELFLCGQCSAGFPTIDICKEHMAKEHSITEWGTETTDLPQDEQTRDGEEDGETTDTPAATEETPQEPSISDKQDHDNNRVSIATQSEKRKPGRKTKSEMLEMKKKEQEEKEEEFAYIEEPGKRKRRMPIHLIQDFAVPKVAKIAPAVRTKKQEAKIEKKKKQSSFTIKCADCRARFESESALEYHMTTHQMSDDQEIIYVCPEPDCDDKGQAFRSSVWSEFKMHAWKTHTKDLGMLKCDLCDHRSTHFSKLMIHKEIHSDKKPYKCDICPKSFKQSAQLKNHGLTHMAGVDVTEKESSSGRHWFVQSQCDICKRTFANGKSLACHVEAVHEKVKPYRCQFCGHTAARKAMMQLHLRTHTGEKPFKCDICEYSTGDHNSLRRHRMRHSGEKPYQCPHCSYACIQAVSLKLHLKSKHPGSESFFSCQKCHYRTVNKTLYVNHMRDHENGLIETISEVQEPDIHLTGDQLQLSNDALSSGGMPIKLGAINDMTNGSSNTTQLICSALNAIAHNLTDDGEPLPDNIETTVHTISNLSGIKAHKITFHIPPTATKSAKTAEVVVQETSSTAPLDPLQAATIASEIPTSEATVDNDIQTTQVETGDGVLVDSHQMQADVTTEMEVN